MQYLRIHQLHDSLFQIVQVHCVLRWGTRYDVVLVVIVTTHRSELLCIRKLDVDAVLLHDALDAATSDADDTLMVGLRNVERDLGRQFLLEKSKSLQDRCVIAGDVDQEVVFVESLKLNLHVSSLHDLVDLAVLLATNELAVLIGKLDLEANLMVKALYEKAPIRHNEDEGRVK